MSLTDYERELLKGARTIVANSESGFGTRFICCAITDADGQLTPEWEIGAGEKSRVAWNLRKRIESVLDGNYTFEKYLYRKYGYRPHRYLTGGREDAYDKYGFPPESVEITYLTYEEFYNLARECRLAWIDRMLDNNEVS